MKRIIIAGIHTEVGKSVIAAIVTEALQGCYWKPIQCGMPRDRDWVNERLSQPGRCYPEHLRLNASCSPHLAARIENVNIQAKDLIPPTCFDPLIIEGTGGILAPLNEKENWLDAAVHWNAQWILVHRHYLGSLNHFLLTMEAMQHRNLPLLGVIFNGEGDLETEQMLLQQTNTRCLGRLLWYKELTPNMIQKTAKTWKQTLILAL